MRISDWSSDVCSSDLPRAGHTQPREFAGFFVPLPASSAPGAAKKASDNPSGARTIGQVQPADGHGYDARFRRQILRLGVLAPRRPVLLWRLGGRDRRARLSGARWAERGVGKGWVSAWRDEGG